MKPLSDHIDVFVFEAAATQVIIAVESGFFVFGFVISEAHEERKRKLVIFGSANKHMNIKTPINDTMRSELKIYCENKKWAKGELLNASLWTCCITSIGCCYRVRYG